MLTLFTTAKPFRGHDDVIQRNALQSWTLLHPDVEVILFGDEEGAAEVCRELGLRHEPYVQRHESGAPYLNHMFVRAQELSSCEYLCFSNCDIVLMEDFWKAFHIARLWKKEFLMVGQRWDADVVKRIDFARSAKWSEELRLLARKKGCQQDPYWIDFFLFSKGLYTSIPSLIVGHCYWDNWMIWNALSANVSVLDASRFLVPVHQNHGYSAASGRVKGVPTDALSLQNLCYIGGRKNVRHIKSATHCLTRNGRIRWNVSRHTYESGLARKLGMPRLKRDFVYKIWLPAWHTFLRITRPVRSALGLRSRDKFARVP